MSSSFSKEYKGYHITYNEGVIKIFESKDLLNLLMTSECNIKSEKDLEVEIMWLVDDYETKYQYTEDV